MDPHAIQARVDEMMSDFSKMRDNFDEMQEKVNAIRREETSSDGLVTAVVDSRGQLLSLELDPRLYRNPDSRGLADSITRTVQEASAAAREELVQTCEPYLPGTDLRASMDMDLDKVLRRLTADLDFKGGFR